MKQSFRFKGHESFVIREGWLNKGLHEVKRNPRVFFEYYGADALGVGPNMAKSIRYWLKCSGLTDESVRTVVHLTDLGEIILQEDPYFENLFSLWIIHCNIACNQSQATAWQFFFNIFDYEEFTIEELEREMLELVNKTIGEQKISIRSITDDCDAILHMYAKKRKNYSHPEEKNRSPFGILGLLKATEGGYAKMQPELNKLPAEIVLYLLTETMKKAQGISMEELLTIENGPGRILNLKRIGLVELLEQLERAGKIILNQTAGLDMVYLPKPVKGIQIVQDYYRN
ncbi:MAG: DUF4007 family protein [Lachnospiraceae bacterium]